MPNYYAESIDTNLVLHSGTDTTNHPEDEAIREAQEFKAKYTNHVWADTEFAQSFIDAHQPDEFKYVIEEKQFVRYHNGQYIECHDLPYLIHKHIATEIWNVPSKKEAKLEKSLSDSQRQKLLSIEFACKVVKALSHHPRIIISSTEFDTDPFLLNTPDVVVDLSTGDCLPHNPAYRMRKITAVSPLDDEGSARCTNWTALLNFYAHGTRSSEDKSLQDFLEAYYGYCLSGSVNDRTMLFLIGEGQNGKTKMLELMQYILGDYSATVPVETFIDYHSPQHSVNVAELQGIRLVQCEELEGSKNWNESLLKGLTSGTTRKARKLNQNNTEFKPVCKLAFYANEIPKLRHGGKAIEDRLRIVALPHRVPEDQKDPELENKLKKEAPYILYRLIQAGIQYHQRKYAKAENLPDRVKTSTATYLNGEGINLIAKFEQEFCQRTDQPTDLVTLKEFKNRCIAFAAINGEDLSPNVVTAYLRNQNLYRGYAASRTKQGASVPGLSWKRDDQGALLYLALDMNEQY